jgi:hypothetical protein
MRSLPGWSEEIYAEHLQSAHALSTEKPGDPAFLPVYALSLPFEGRVAARAVKFCEQKLKLTVPTEANAGHQGNLHRIAHLAELTLAWKAGPRPPKSGLAEVLSRAGGTLARFSHTTE